MTSRSDLSRAWADSTLSLRGESVYTWDQELRKGKRWLARHKPDIAVDCFRRAMLVAPSAKPGPMASILYYHGLALYKTGHRGRAIARWVQSQRHLKFGHTRKVLRRCTNAYGMPKQDSSEKDDWHAFLAVHLSRYLRKKKSGRLDTRAETDMIRELIDDYWRGLLSSNALDGKTVDEKRELFHKIVIVFPFFEMPDRLDDSLVHVDFDAKRRLTPSDRCTCGSGLQFKLCCGRTPGEDELMSGDF